MEFKALQKTLNPAVAVLIKLSSFALQHLAYLHKLRKAAA
jgi:hypothetical protein